MSTDPIVVALATLALAWVSVPMMTPDGSTYARRAAGEAVAAPFAWRVWPRIARGLVTRADGVVSWTPRAEGAMMLTRWACVGASAQIIAAHWGVWAALLWLGLPIARVQGSWAWTADAAGQALALAAIGAPWWAQLALGLACGVVGERAPVFAAAYAWSPWPLAGLVVPAVARLVVRRGEPSAAERGIIDHPIASALAFARGAGAGAYLLPWGVVLAAVAWLDARAWLVTALAYAQCAVAVDRARLYQWAAPAWCAALGGAMTGWHWAAFVIAAHWASPWRERTEGCER